MWDDEFLLSGTIDDPIFYEDRTVDINDWKSNKKIDKSNKYTKGLFPISHLENTKLNIYTLQLSFYGLILERKGFKVRNLTLTHITEEKEEIIPLKYLREECLNIIQDYVSNSNK